MIGTTAGENVDVSVVVSSATDSSDLVTAQVKVLDVITGLTATVDTPAIYPNSKVTVTVAMDAGVEDAQ